MNTYSKELEICLEIARDAGAIMLQYFDQDKDKKMKEDNSPVTIADLLINRMVIEKLTAEFPDDGVIGEEESTSGYGMGRKWFCDPIDGTNGYIWGTPTSMFSLALVIDGKPVLGVTYDPFLDKYYKAVKGLGSYCNDKQLHVSDKVLQGGTIAVSGSVAKLRKLDYLDEFTKKGTHLATFNGAVYKSCLVAKGNVEGYMDSFINAHDVAAIHVIIEEAGGKITRIDGGELDYTKPFKGAVISNGVIHNDILNIISAD